MKSKKEKGHYLFTSESVTEGHPDKICDQMSDAILDAMIGQDPASRVACECLVTTGLALVSGEITSTAQVDIVDIVRGVVHGIGYIDASYGFDADTTALARIAEKTKGMFFSAHLTDITQVYQKILAHAGLGSILAAVNDTIRQGQTLTYPSQIGADVSSAIFVAEWQGSRVDLRLVSPSGIRITPTNFRVQSGVNYI